MRIKQINGNPTAERIVLTVNNSEASSTISKGSPVCLAGTGSSDGFAVVLPATAAKAHSMFFGVASADIVAGANGDVTVFGYCPYALIQKNVRAASTDSWTSQQSIASFVLLNVDTANNAFSTSGGTQAVSAFLPAYVLMESVASQAASASATSDTRTAITAAHKIFLRAM